MSQRRLSKVEEEEEEVTLHLILGGQVDPQLQSCVFPFVSRHLGVDDPSASSHPLEDDGSMNHGDPDRNDGLHVG